MNLKCLFGHKWNGCKCERYGRIREGWHNWMPLGGNCIEKCSVCDEERTIAHKWKGCKCERCGATRDVGHEWVLLNKEKGIEKLCSICKKEVWHKNIENQSTTNKWNGCKCERCGETRDEEHDWKLFTKYNGDCSYAQCSICGERVEYKKHQLVGCKCSRCERVVHSYKDIPFSTLPSRIQSEINKIHRDYVGVVTKVVTKQCSSCGDIK